MQKLNPEAALRAAKMIIEYQYMPNGLTASEQATWRTMYYAVLKDTHASYKARLAANGAVTRMRPIGRSLPITSKSATDFLAGWGVRYGNAQYRDRHNQYFTEKSDLYLQAYSGSIPVFWRHTSEQVAVRRAYDLHDFGIFFVVKLLATPRKAALMRDGRAGKLGFSSGSILHIAEKRAHDGWISKWPLAELSLCPIDDQCERSLSNVIPFFYTPGANRA